MNDIQESFQKFITVADRLNSDIVNGLYPSGKSFLSRNEICEKFNISLKTAHKVQQELCKRGLICANKGRTFTVCDPNNRGGVPLREIRLLRQNQFCVTDYVMDEISSGIKEVCQNNNLEFNEIYLELQDKHHHKLSSIGGNEPGQGIVLLPYRSIMSRGAGYFLKYWQPFRVTIDFPLPGTSGVLQDEFDVIDSIFNDIAKQNISSVMQIPHNTNVWNPLFSQQCYRFGLLLSQKLNLKMSYENNPEINLVIENINTQRPEVLIFHSGQKALLDMVLPKLIYQPVIYVICRGKGELEYCQKLSKVKTYFFDYKDFGIAAAQLLLTPDNGYPKREYIYVKGKLI
jgi:DNA-binding transcriptional regulator YhcF (GntR family)